MSQRMTRTLHWRRAAVIAIAAAGLSACGQAPPDPAQAEPSLVSDRSLRADRPFEADAPRVVVLGDSLDGWSWSGGDRGLSRPAAGAP